MRAESSGRMPNVFIMQHAGGGAGSLISALMTIPANISSKHFHLYTSIHSICLPVLLKPAGKTLNPKI